MIDAMKQALEALEMGCTDINGNEVDLVTPAITALRQAIEQAEKQERIPESWMGITDNPYCDDLDCNDPNGRAMRWHNKLLDLRKQAALDGLAETTREIEQEPVCDKDPHLCWSVRCQLGKVCKNTAPPKREWQGLTDKEIADFSNWVSCIQLIEAVESKLKERNT